MIRPVRTRYAPSPTGDPHVGNIRAALFSWAFARANGGAFILRIEDTDRNRLVESSLEAIMESLVWLDIEPDEGPRVGGDYGPYFQSQRHERYHSASYDLVERGRAYRCFCTPERLDRMRAEQAAAKRPPGYDGLCRDIDPATASERARTEPFVIRFLMERTGETIVDDVVRGPVRFDNALQDDFVILKADGFPTYHLAVVVDDTAMEISHVIRGDEWISSAPKHIQLYEALGWEPPIFAHLPLILGPNGKKLSKRDGDVAVLDYRSNGYLPEAMINFLAFLGWSLDDRTSIISREELARVFSLDRIVPNPAVFDISRLDSLNGHYIREMDAARWKGLVDEQLTAGLPGDIERPIDPDVVRAVAPLLKERVTRLTEIAPTSAFLFGFDAPQYPVSLLSERLDGGADEALRVIDAALLALDAVPADGWDAESVEAAIRSLQDTLGIKLRKFVTTLYVAIMGRPQGIPLFDSMAILGRDRSLARLRTARLAVGG